MKIIIGRQHWAFEETHRRRFSRCFGISRGRALSTAAILNSLHRRWLGIVRSKGNRKR